MRNSFFHVEKSRSDTHASAAYHYQQQQQQQRREERRRRSNLEFSAEGSLPATPVRQKISADSEKSRVVVERIYCVRQVLDQVKLFLFY